MKWIVEATHKSYEVQIIVDASNEDEAWILAENEFGGKQSLSNGTVERYPKYATLTQLLREAGEALEPFAIERPGLAKYRRAADLRRKIQEVVG